MEIFENFLEAKNYLSQIQKGNPKKIFFRGEKRNYEKVATSIDRGQYDYEERLIEMMYLNMLASNIDETIQRFIILSGLNEHFQNFKNIYTRGDLFNVSSQESQIHIVYNIVALLQHYGWETNFLDITNNLDTAFFFSSYDFNTNSFNEDEFGYIHYFDFGDNFPNLLIYDLNSIAKAICNLFEIKENRPLMQNAFSVRIFDESDTNFLNEIKKTIKYKRNGIKKHFIPKNHFFPNDNLYLFLKSQELEYAFKILKASTDESYKSRISKKIENFHFAQNQWIT